MTEHRESDVAVYIHTLLQTEGIQSELMEVEQDRLNVTAILKGTGGGRSLMLNGHLDTVPAYDMKDPLSGRVKDGRLFGRGSCDMKGPLASMLAAFIGIKQSGIELMGDLVFSGVVDEEEMGKGIIYLATHGPFADGAVIGEPTGMHLALGHKGLEWIKIEVFGKKVHGGRMDEGINAVTMAGRLIERIDRQYAPILYERTHPVLGRSTINIGKISGGDQPSTVPGICILEIDRRWIPSESLDQVYEELRSILADLHRQDPKFHAEIRGYYPPEEPQLHHPFCTDATDPIVISALHALSCSGFQNLEPTSFPAWSDAGVLTKCTDAKCIIMGPGNLAVAHTAEEYIEVEEMEKAALCYGDMAIDYCKKKG